MSRTTFSKPRFSIVRKPLVLTHKVTQRRSDSSQNRRLWELTLQTRFVVFFEYETEFPLDGFFWRTSQRLGMLKW